MVDDRGRYGGCRRPAWRSALVLHCVVLPCLLAGCAGRADEKRDREAAGTDEEVRDSGRDPEMPLLGAVPAWDVVTRALPRDEEMMLFEEHAWTNALTFPTLSATIPLGAHRAARMSESGFDRGSLRVRWLAPDQVLWVSYGTVPQGSGAYTDETHVLLLVRKGACVEKTRQTFHAFGCGGLDDCTEVHVTFRYVPATRRIRQQVERIERAACADAGTLREIPEAMTPVLRMKYVEVVAYALTADDLVETEVETYLDLEDRVVASGDLARMLAGKRLPVRGPELPADLFSSWDAGTIARTLGMSEAETVSGRIGLPRCGRRLLPPLEVPKAD